MKIDARSLIGTRNELEPGEPRATGVRGRSLRLSGGRKPTLGLLGLVAVAGCLPEAKESRNGPAAVRLASVFDPSKVEGEPPEWLETGDVIDWRFDRPWEPLPPEKAEEDAEEEGDSDTEAPAKQGEDTGDPESPTDVEERAEDPDSKDEPGPIVHGVEALTGIEGLEVVDGRLQGRVTTNGVLRLERRPDGDEPVHGFEVTLRLPEGGTVAVRTNGKKEVDRSKVRRSVTGFGMFSSTATLDPSDEIQTCVIELLGRSDDTSDVRHLYLQPTDGGKPFEIESVRLVTRSEHLATQSANIDWRGLGEVYRPALLMHLTEAVHFDIHLPSRPWLDLAVGTVEAYPTTFLVELTPEGGEPVRVLRRTVTTEERWEDTPLELGDWAGESVRLTFRIRSDHKAQTGYFGGLVLHDRGALPAVEAEPRPNAPRGVIFVLADTLRRDHLDAYGYGRDTAPFLRQLADEGALFKDDISQASWTKVSVPSILTSLYPVTSGVTKQGDKVPDEATVLAENFQAAGYATFATSSIPFSGRASNLQQGIDELHERGSVAKLDHSWSKTSRTFVDRVTDWVEDHDEQPFFVFLHVFDPHSPFDPYEPYAGMWSEEGAGEAQEKDMETVKEGGEDLHNGLPDRQQLDAAGVCADTFVKREHDFYDESIRAMDAELRRLHERLEDLGLADDTLIVVTSDHGEEFLEHDRHFHGNSTYGEMTNVPLLFWGPRWVPAGTVVEETVQNIDIYPTLLEMCDLPEPEGIQGTSLMDLIHNTGKWRPRPAFASRFSEKEVIEEKADIASFAVVSRGYRLVKNVRRPEGHPEFELYDHRADPLNITDVAEDHPEKVEVLAREIELWEKWTESVALINESGEAGAEMSEAELEALRQLGYVGG